MTSKPDGTSTARLIDGRYQILEDLGSGRDGHVCLAFDRVREQRVALKWVDVKCARRAGALRDEYELGARLGHPGWPQVFERGRDGDIEYFTMEYIDGTPLPERVSSLGLAEILSLLHQACGALGALHSQRIVHADLNPDHLLVVDGPEGPRLTLLDLSLALKTNGAPIGASEPADAQLRGTLEFASAAVLEGLQPQALDDLFALGSSFERSLAQRERTMEPGDEERARVLTDVLRRLTTNDPDTRYRSARHAQRDLRRAWPLDARPPRDEAETWPLLGCVGELEAFDHLLDAFQAAPAGSSTLVTGAPGTGKSRLLAEFERRVRRRGLPLTSLTALQGQDWARLQRELYITHARDDRRLAHALETLEPPTPDTGESSTREHATRTVELLRRAAGVRPLIVFVRLAPARPAQAAALRALWSALLELPSATPLWLLASSESEPICAEANSWNTSILPTQPLSRSDAGLLAYEFLASERPWIEERIHEHCRGHAEFTVAAARAAETATKDEDLSLAALDRIIHAELPASVERSLRADIAQLAAPARTLAGQLAVFANGARDAVLARYLDDQVERATSAALIEAGMLVRTEDPEGASIVSLHESLRRIFAGDLDPEIWTELNLRAHAAWKREAPDRRRALALAGHAIEANDRDLSCEEAACAADLLLAERAAEPAFQVLQCCVERWDTGNAENERTLSPVLARIGECHVQLGRLEQADRAFQRATKHLAPEVDSVALWSRWGEALDGMGRPEQARGALQRALSRPASEGSEEGANACGILGRIEYRLGNSQAASETFERGLAMLSGRAPCGAAASLQNDLGVMAYHAGRLDEAVQHHTDALRLREELDDQDGIARSLTNLGSIHMSRGHNLAARASYRASLVIKRTLGNKQSIALTLSNLALLDHWLGRYGSSIQGHEEALGIRTAIGATPDQVRSLTHLARVLNEKGAFPRAMLCAEQALDLAERSGERDEGFVQVQCARAEVMNSLGWGDRARTAIDDGLRASTALDYRVGTGVLHGLRAQQLIQTEPANEDRRRRVLRELEASHVALSGVEKPYVVAETLLRSCTTLLDARDLEPRLDWLEEGARIAEQLEAPGLVLKAELLRAHACMSAGRPTEASVRLFAALDSARALSTPDLLWRAYAGMARFQVCFGRRDRALLWLQRCMGVFRDVLRQMPDPSMQSAYLEASARRQVLDSVANWVNLPSPGYS